jgi:septal ring factor EnvC (AmiA/AmiB activator)
VQLAEGGGGYNPAGWLYEPTPGDPVPTTFDGVIGVADWLSLGHWALVVLDKVDGDFDLVEKV